MIESLHAMHETVNFKADTHLRLYHNDQPEDYPEHWHTPLELILPLENSYSATIGRHTITLAPTDILVICPGVLHSLKAPAQGSRIIFQAEITMFTAIRDFESILSLMSPALKISGQRSPDIHGRIYDLMLEISEAYDSGFFLLETIIYSRLLEIFYLIGGNIGSNPGSSIENGIESSTGRDTGGNASSNFTGGFEHFSCDVQLPKEYAEKFLMVCTYISEHCTENLSLDDVASVAGFSKYHFARLFKQFTSTTFYKYLNLKRMEHARKLLANPEIPITDVAFSSGYTSLSAFIRMFKLTSQCTPTEYRNLFTNTPYSQ